MNEWRRLNYGEMFLMMTTPANAIREEVWQLIDDQIEAFRRPSCITPSELSERHCRAERIRQLGQELDRISGTSILEQRFGRVA
jgi:hypothetical protein